MDEKKIAAQAAQMIARMDSKDCLWSIMDIAAYVGCSRARVDKLRADPCFPERVNLPGGLLRYQSSAVKQFLSSSR